MNATSPFGNFMSVSSPLQAPLRHTTSWPRFALAGVAVLALLFWYVVTAAPVVFVVVFGLLWLGAPGASATVAGVLAFAFMAWVTTPTGYLEGEPVTREQMPGLFAALDELQSSLATPPVQRVLMNDEFNAGAHQTGAFGLPLFSRQTVLLGWPLLAALSAPEAKAVLAHELGHLSRRHGLWGHWIYRARLHWMALSAPTHADDSPFDRAVQWFAKGFAPWFAAKTYPYARACEFEADHEAARVASGHDLVRALLRLHIGARRLAAWAEQRWPYELCHTDTPSLRHFTSMTRALIVSEFTEDDVQHALSRRPNPEDTHPTVAQRAAALKIDLSQTTAPSEQGVSAGQAWSGGRWPQRIVALDEQALATQGAEWRADALHLRHLVEHLALLGNEPADWAQRIAAWRQLGNLEAVAAAITPATKVDAQQAGVSAWLRWELLAQRIDHDTAVGAAVHGMEALVAADPAYAWPVRQRLLAHAVQTGDDAAVRKQQALAQRALRRREEAADAVHRALESGQLQPTTLPPAALAAFGAQLSAHACLRGAWLAQAEGSSEDGRRFAAQVMVLHVDAQQMLALKQDEDSLRESYWRQLRRWRRGPQELVVVRVCFLAEARLPKVLDATPAWRWRG
jgi:Zn-dependent protease with chaperone function